MSLGDALDLEFGQLCDEIVACSSMEYCPDGPQRTRGVCPRCHAVTPDACEVGLCRQCSLADADIADCRPGDAGSPMVPAGQADVAPLVGHPRCNCQLGRQIPNDWHEQNRPLKRAKHAPNGTNAPHRMTPMPVAHAQVRWLIRFPRKPKVDLLDCQGFVVSSIAPT